MLFFLSLSIEGALAGALYALIALAFDLVGMRRMQHVPQVGLSVSPIT